MLISQVPQIAWLGRGTSPSKRYAYMHFSVNVPDDMEGIRNHNIDTHDM